MNRIIVSHLCCSINPALNVSENYVYVQKSYVSIFVVPVLSKTIPKLIEVFLKWQYDNSSLKCSMDNSEN